MEWKCFFATAAYILTVCDPVLGANTIINVTLVDGETPNEGRVDYLILDASTWQSACGFGLGSQEASVVCRHLGYPGVNNLFTQWPFGTRDSIAQDRFSCDGDEENLANCSLVMSPSCSDELGVICYGGIMEWKCFFAISAYILTVCDPVLGATMIIDVTLVDGEKPNEGRVEYFRSDASTWESACWLRFDEGSVICRQLGYPGVNNVLVPWHHGSQPIVGKDLLICAVDAENLSNCSLFIGTCPNAGGVICYALEELQTPCEYGLEDSQGFTIPNCVSCCNHANDTYTFAGVYNRDTCLCGNASTNINQSDRVADWRCSYFECAGRIIERCGGASYIALFNIATYMQQSMSNNTGNGGSGRQTSTGPISAGTGTAETTAVTEIQTSQGTSSPSENLKCPPKPECSAFKGVLIGLIIFVVVLLLYAVAINFLDIQLRRKVPTVTGENGPAPYMDLQPRPEAGSTYQEIAITSAVGEGARYENVLTPN